MSSDRKGQTLADYVALAISPALVMGLVGSLVYFLLNVLYAGEYVGRLQWTLFFFVFAIVLLARMTITEETSGRALIYAVPLGVLTWIAMMKFADLDGFSSAFLLAVVWWSAHRLTWDCTNINEETDVNAQGLLQAAGLDNEADEKPPEPEAEKPPEPQGFWQRWQRYRAERARKRTLGVWVVWFSLAALPLFGLGQALLPAEDLARRRWSFWLMVVYVGCGLGLLLTTCFLSLRRYLRQRELQMPRAMTAAWLTSGGLLIAGLLAVGALLPRPDAEYSPFSFAPAKGDKRAASRYAVKGGEAGEGEGRPAADEQKDDEKADSGGREGEQKGQRGEATRQGDNGSGGRDGKSGQGGDKKGQQGGRGQQQAKGDARSGQDRPAPKEGGRQDRKGEDERTGDDERGQKDGERSEEGRSDSGSSAKSSLSELRELAGRASAVLKWVVFAVLALIVLIYVLRGGLRFLANFSDWARRLLEAWRNFWANLFGGRRETAERQAEEEEPEEVLRERPFAAFANPFAGGQSGMATAELIRYTFAAAQAWARERGLGRQPGETPLEFADRVGGEVPALEADLRRLAALYARAVYARGGVPANSVELLRQFWQRLETVAEQPLSA